MMYSLLPMPAGQLVYLFAFPLWKSYPISVPSPWGCSEVTYQEVCGHLLYYLFMAKNDRCSRHVQYICIQKTIKITLANYCIPPTLSPFNNLSGKSSVEQLSASPIMLNEAQFTEI